MNDQSTPIDEAPATGISYPDDPEYQASLHDTQVTQRLVDALEQLYADAGDEDRDILKQTLNDLRRAYEAIRPDNDWALDIC